MIVDYYNALAPYYRFMLQDWNASVIRQAAVLDSVIHEFFGSNAKTIWDAACGIGTQSIGLAQLGYDIHASDISSAEIAHAQAEAIQRGLHITFGIADMREISQINSNMFDVVIACDNAIPHLLSDHEIQRAFEVFYQCTVPNGVCVISVRDYDNLERGGSKLVPRHIHTTVDGQLIVFDLWEFDGDFYDFTTYIVEDRGEAATKTHIFRGGRYYCVALATLERLLRKSGFQRVKTIKGRYFQPLLVGMK